MDVDNTETINILSLCTGYGGLELGLAGALEGVFRVVAVEVEAYALANLAAKAQKNKLAIEAMWPDLKTFPAERFRGCFDFIIAGIPCTPWTSSGQKRGTKDARWIWPFVSKIIKEIKPSYIFLENVPRIIQHGGFTTMLQDLASMGYDAAWGCCTAASVGAHQVRDRLFAVARLESIRSAQWLSIKKQYERPETQRTDNSNYIAQSRRQRKIPRAWIEPELGRLVYGTPNRVERLRLLGNGVVPQQAQKAFVELYKLFDNSKF